MSVENLQRATSLKFRTRWRGYPMEQILPCCFPYDGSNSWWCLRVSGYDCYAGSEHQGNTDLWASRAVGRSIAHFHPWW